jgi:uncharacterized protein YecT (DUF1311 family)
MRRYAIALMLCAVCGTGALARGCGNDANQAELNVCAGEALAKADGELNALYKEVARRLQDEPMASKLLVAAEKAWIAFRDAECAFRTWASADGSIHPMLAMQCREDLTRKRLDALKAYLACEEGDLSCPVPQQ